MQKYIVLAQEAQLEDGRIVKRIQAVRDFGTVKKGTLGGFVETVNNLSQKGKAMSRAIHNFTGGTTHLVLGDIMRHNNVTGTSIGKLLDLHITSGRLSDGSAIGVLLTTINNGGSANLYNERTGAIACYRSGNSYCDRNFVTPGSWVANDLLEPVSDLDLFAIENGGNWYDPVSVTDKPKIEMPIRPCHSIDERAIAGYLAPGDYAAFWLQQHILPNVPAHAAVTGCLGFSWY